MCHDRVFVGAFYKGALVGGVETCGAFLFLLAEAFRLAGAADTACGAGHDFDKVEMLLAAFDLLDQSFSVTESAYDSCVDVFSSYIRTWYLSLTQHLPLRKYLIVSS